MNQLTNPEYLFCELPIKDGSMNDDRAWIYCTKFMSLIEIWPFEFGPAIWPKEQFQKNYTYFPPDGEPEDFLFVFTQDNVEMVNGSLDPVLEGPGASKESIMDGAWEFFRSYLEWENGES